MLHRADVKACAGNWLGGAETCTLVCSPKFRGHIMSNLEIKRATPDDADELVSIYRPIVEETAISFELRCPTEEEFAQRIRAVSETHAWLVAEIDSCLSGYAYGTPHRPREAYKYSVETSAYIRSDFRGRGIGARLYERLFEDLLDLGYFHAFAGITLPNPASVALHESSGFLAIGTFPCVGFKLGAWHDVSWWHRMINDGDLQRRLKAHEFDRRRPLIDRSRRGFVVGSNRDAPPRSAYSR